MFNAAPAPPTDAAPTDTRPDPGAARRARQRRALALVRNEAVAFHPRYGWTFYGPHGDNELEVRRALQRLTRSGHVVIGDHDPGRTIQPVTLAPLGERTLTILETDGVPKRPRRPTSHQRQYLRKLAGLTSTSYGEPNRRSLASMTAVGAITEAGRAILQPSRMASSAASSGSRSIPERRAKHAWDDGDDWWGERPVAESAAP